MPSRRLRQLTLPTQCLHQPHRPTLHSLPCYRNPLPRTPSHTPHRTLFDGNVRRNRPPPSSLDFINQHRLSTSKDTYFARKTKLYAILTALSMLATLVVVSQIDLDALEKDERNDAPSGDKKGFDGARVEVVGRGPPEGMVATGTTTVPWFPRRITVPLAKREGGGDTRSRSLPAGLGEGGKEEDEYELLGVGIRTVSFLSIQVYVVGFYVARADLALLQAKMVRLAAGAEGATTVVGDEREGLRRLLLEGRAWADVLREGGIRSCVRIVPTRNTDFAHLRDGWVRGIGARGVGGEFADVGFGEAVRGFKGLFGGRGKLGKGGVLLLGRGKEGELGAWVKGEGEGKGGMELLGRVADERVGRLVWEGYLGGGKVASLGLRGNVVEGVLELVGRPVGTVETMVV